MNFWGGINLKSERRKIIDDTLKNIHTLKSDEKELVHRISLQAEELKENYREYMGMIKEDDDKEHREQMKKLEEIKNQTGDDATASINEMLDKLF